MRKGFTLVELLVVIGIMAGLGTVATAGYFAVVRGMEERGALSSVTSLIDAAQQRARMDRVPTAVLFYNELVNDEESASDDTQHAGVCGVAVAIRRSGRITRAEGSSEDSLLFDEFADLDRVYNIEGDDQGVTSGMRLYQFRGMDDMGASGDLRYSIVHTDVVCEKRVLPDEKLLFSSPNGAPVKIWASAFRIKDPKRMNWRTGDAYAFEFANVRLQKNYFFKGTLPTSYDDPVKLAGVMVFDPNESRTDITSERGSSTIEIQAYRPGGSGLRAQSIGETGRNLRDL